MIIIPLYMNKFNITPQVVSPEEKAARLAIRNKVIALLQEHPSLTTKEIANAIGKDVRAANALLITMQKEGKINSTSTDCGRVWRLD